MKTTMIAALAVLMCTPAMAEDAPSDEPVGSVLMEQLKQRAAMPKPDQPKAEERAIKLNKPIDIGEGREAAQRLGQIQWASHECKDVIAVTPVFQQLYDVVLQANADATREVEIHHMFDRAKTIPNEILCSSLMKAFGPDGTVLKGALYIDAELAKKIDAEQRASGEKK